MFRMFYSKILLKEKNKIMMFRNISFILLSILEIVLLILVGVKKSSNHVAKWVLFSIFGICLVATLWVMVFPGTKVIEPTGSNEVQYVEDHFIDENRLEYFKNDSSKRELQIGMWFPKGKEDKSCPLVIFSHGSFGNINNNKTLCTELASRGCVVVSISHTYHAFETTLKDGTKVKVSSEFINEVINDQPSKDINASYEHFKKWMELRTGDISFVIDEIKRKVDTDEEAYKMIDASKVIVMGHSLGGNAALGMPRLRDDISMVVALESSFMCDIIGIEGNRFVYTSEEFPVPVLNVYSDSSYSHLSEWVQYEQNYRILNSTDPRYVNEYIPGIGHMHLCDFQLESPFLSWILSGRDSKTSAETNLRKINEIVIRFLKNNGVNIE